MMPVLYNDIAAGVTYFYRKDIVEHDGRWSVEVPVMAVSHRDLVVVGAEVDFRPTHLLYVRGDADRAQEFREGRGWDLNRRPVLMLWPAEE